MSSIPSLRQYVTDDLEPYLRTWLFFKGYPVDEDAIADAKAKALAVVIDIETGKRKVRKDPQAYLRSVAINAVVEKQRTSPLSYSLNAGDQLLLDNASYSSDDDVEEGEAWGWQVTKKSRREARYKPSSKPRIIKALQGLQGTPSRRQFSFFVSGLRDDWLERAMAPLSNPITRDMVKLYLEGHSQSEIARRLLKNTGSDLTRPL